MDIDSRPLHITIGWKDLGKYKEDEYPWRKMFSEFSIINFAMFAAGWADRKLIEDLIKKGVDEHGHLKGTIRDTGRSQMLRRRDYQYDQLEFRCFSPSKYDQPRLLEAVGYLSTAARGYVSINTNQEKKSRKEFTADRKLHAVWLKFRKEVKNIYDKFGNIPSLENANEWIDREYNNRIDNFFKKMVEDWDKEDGVSADMRKLIRQTVKEIKKILGD